MTTTSRPPGWYDDPNDPNAQRYWDGQDWTPHRQRKQASRPAARQQPPPPEQPSGRSAPPPPPPRNEPPPPPPSNVPPPPPGQAQPRAASRVTSGAIKTAAIVAGVALVLVIAAFVAGRVQFGSFLPGILIVAAIAAIIAFFMLRSQRPVALKALVVTAIVAVVAVAIPASSKVVFPVYSHFFGTESGPGSQAEPGGSGSGPGGSHHGGGSGKAADAPTSGILVMSNDASGLNYGYIDPGTGKYGLVSTFNVTGSGSDATSALEQVSPDLTKLATMKQDDTAGPMSASRAGWIDTSGKFTAVSPAAPKAGDFQQSLPPTYSSPHFDGAGNFYYVASQDGKYHLYKLPSGSTSDPQEVTPTPKTQGTAPLRNPDGTLNFDCAEIPGQWLGSDSRMEVASTSSLPGSSSSSSSPGFAIVKYPITTTGSGCPSIKQGGEDVTKVFDLGIQNVSQPVANPDGTKIAFINTNSPGGLYVVDVGGDNKSNRIASPSDLDLGQMTLIGWN